MSSSHELKLDNLLERHAQDTIEERTAFEEFLSHHSEEAIYSDMTVEEFFAHWGVKGMRWGVRKDRSESSSTDGPHEDHINVSALRKKKVSQLSNAEMKAVTERMNLEKKYRELNPSDHELLMRKLKKRADTAAKITKWMVGPEGGKLLKAMGLDGKSRRADEKQKEKIKLEEAMAKQRAKNAKKAARKEAKVTKPKGFKEQRGPGGGAVYNPDNLRPLKP